MEFAASYVWWYRVVVFTRAVMYRFVVWHTRCQLVARRVHPVMYFVVLFVFACFWVAALP